MKIKKVTLENYKGFVNKTFDINERFTVFIGKNAKGKTSILDALSVAVGGYLLGIDTSKSEAKGIGQSAIRVHTIDNEPRPQLPSKITAEGEMEGENIGWVRYIDEITKKTTTKYRVTKGYKSIKSIAEANLKKSRDKGGVTFPLIVYHGTGRLWAEHEKINYKEQTEGVGMAYKYCLSRKSSSLEFLEWYKTYEDEILKFDQPKDKILLEVFKKGIATMIPDNRWQDMAFSNKDSDLIGIFTDNSGNKEKLKYKQLSDGYRGVIGMVADIIYRCIKLNPHLGDKVLTETSGVVLIDELDLHLHPSWQVKIVSDLKDVFPKIQFVATTHSPYILQSLSIDEIRNLDNDEELLESPKDMPLSKVSSEIMNVNVRSDDFEVRYKKAIIEMGKIENKGKEISLDDYKKISLSLGELIKSETTDPVLKAYIEKSDDKKQ